MKRNRGFTLVEIMIVIAIIGMLAIIAIPSMFQARAKTLISTCINNLRQIDGGKDMYALDHENAVPADVDGLVPSYIKRTPDCRGGGEYTVGELDERPTCSESDEGHTL